MKICSSCIIVDASKFKEFFNSTNKDSEPVRKWLNNGGKLIYSTCGKFAQDFSKHKKKIMLKNYVRDGKAFLVPCKRFIAQEQYFKNCKLLKSNDPHILALAKYTGARLLYTEDPDLIKDFKNLELLRPKGKIYSRRSNADLLTKTKCAN